MKPAPAAALEVIKPELLLELLVIALDPPAQLGQPDQTRQRGGGIEIGEPTLSGASAKSG